MSTEGAPSPDARKVINPSGRAGDNNQGLFRDLRLWAYDQVHDHDTLESFQTAVLAQGHQINQHPPLYKPGLWYGCSDNVVKSTAEKISVWVWDRTGSDP